MEGFFQDHESKNEVYCGAFDILNSVKDEKLRGQMTEVFAKLREINREWYKLVLEAERLQQELYDRALTRAITEFTNRGVDAVEKDVLIATAKMLIDSGVVK